MTAPGANTITATVLQASDEPLPHVQLDVTFADLSTVASWKITRYGGGTTVDIFIGGDSSHAAESFDDYLAPLDVPLTYVLAITGTDHSLTQVTATAILSGVLGCWITQPASGSSQRVTVVTWPARAWSARQTLLEIAGRADPVVMTDVHTWPSGTWTFYTSSDDELRGLVELLTGQRIVMLRTPPFDSIPDAYVAVGNITENRRSNSGLDQSRMTDVDIQEIAPLPATLLPQPGTLGGLSYLVPTDLYDLSQFRATLVQLSQVPTPDYP